MRYFKIRTLVDITETKQFRKEPDRELARQQQQNFSTMFQTISIRANPTYDTSPEVLEINIDNDSFGTQYKGKHLVWEFNFWIEYEGGFTDATGDEKGLLVKDLHLVPIIKGLSETANIDIPIFDTQSEQYRNMIISVATDK